MTVECQRLFVGVPLPEAVGPAVREAQAGLQAPGLRLMRHDQLHVTIAFLGEVGAAGASEAARVVSDQGGSMGGVASLGGIALLPTSRKARVVALEIEDEQGVLGRLFAGVTAGLACAGVWEPEGRPFRPHVTIARLRPAGRVHHKSDVQKVRFAIRSVCLYRSRLSREGAAYEILTEAILVDREDTGA